MSATMSWPPPSLTVNAEMIVDECEFAEISAMDRPLLAVCLSVASQAKLYS